MSENPSAEHGSSRNPLKTNFPLKADMHPKTCMPHRLISSQVGRPLWDYQSDTELLQGFLDALNEHELLWRQQIIPGHIDPESILLADDPRALGAAGFLSDIEAAYVPLEVEPFNPRHIQSAKIHEGITKGGMTLSRQCTCAAYIGNPQFMAIELLRAAITNRTLQRTAEHDIESFTWVLGYCVLRNLCNNAYAIEKDSAEYKFLQESFSTVFGKSSIQEIWASRRSAAPFVWCDQESSGDMEPFFEMHISRPLRELLEYLSDHTFQKQVKKRNLQFDDITRGQMLTYDTLRKRLRWAIEGLQKDPSLDRIH